VQTDSAILLIGVDVQRSVNERTKKKAKKWQKVAKKMEKDESC
jgi:hypothetical protein